MVKVEVEVSEEDYKMLTEDASIDAVVLVSQIIHAMCDGARQLKMAEKAGVKITMQETLLAGVRLGEQALNAARKDKPKEETPP